MLFTVAASLVLLSHLLQPLAEAEAANSTKASVICTMFGMEKASPESGELPPIAAGDCPTCIGGPCAGLDAPPKFAANSEPAFSAPEAYAGLSDRITETRSPPGLSNEPPPAIRAPPLAV